MKPEDALDNGVVTQLSLWLWRVRLNDTNELVLRREDVGMKMTIVREV